MRIDHAPYITEIQEQFCPEREVVRTHKKAVWMRETMTGLMSVSHYEYEHETVTVKSVHKVVQSYILRRLSDSVVRAVAVVSSGGGEKIKVNEWSVLTVDTNKNFAVELLQSRILDQVRDDDDVTYFVANIGGGNIRSKAECLAEDQRQADIKKLYIQQAPYREELQKRKEARRQAEDKEKHLLQQEREDYNARAKYILTNEDIQSMLPSSPPHQSHAVVHKAVKVLRVCTLLNQELKIHICAVIDKHCTWLEYNSSGCHDYSFTSDLCKVTNRFTIVHEESQVGRDLLGKRRVGEVVRFGKQTYLVVNVGGGNFALYHTDWQQEKLGIEQRATAKLIRDAERQKRELEDRQDQLEQDRLEAGYY